MPRFYFEIKNIVHRILLNVCERVRRKKKQNKNKNKEGLMKERKAELNFRNHAVKSFFFLLYLFIYLFIYLFFIFFNFFCICLSFPGNKGISRDHIISQWGPLLDLILGM